MTRNKRVAVLLVVALVFASCATSGRTALQNAELTYIESAFAYDAAMDVIVAARAQHLISDEQWKAVDATQIAVAAAAPTASRLLKSWRASGQKPSGIDAALAVLTGARDVVVAIQKGVKP